MRYNPLLLGILSGLSFGMSQSNRIRDLAFAVVFIAVAMLGLLGTTYLLQQSEQDERRAGAAAWNQQQITANNIQIECLPLGPRGAQPCINRHLAVERERQLQEEETQAQKDVGRATVWLWGLASIQALIGIGGIYYIARTLDETRAANATSLHGARQSARAALAAHETADQARQANEIARATSFREIRPWLHIHADSRPSPKFSGSDMITDTYFTFTNIGRSPAVEVRASGKAYSVVGEIDIKKIVRNFVEDVLEGNLDVPTDVLVVPDGRDTFNPKATIPLEQASRANLGEQVFRYGCLLLCGVSYKSIYDDRTFVTVQSYLVLGDRREDGQPLGRSPTGVTHVFPGGALMR
ncbi:hypothetical protein [Pelagibacterium halotolerans]|uniref:hypothetical protein n=1 Tax=Pelagibacterium halotolerans TaxID=531813 RepID=UPI003850983F